MPSNLRTILRARLKSLQSCPNSPTIQQVVFREGGEPSSRLSSEWGILTMTVIHRPGEMPALPPVNLQKPYKLFQGCDLFELV